MSIGGLPYMARQIFVARRSTKIRVQTRILAFCAQMCKAVRGKGNKEAYIVSFNALQM
jgi:hypothetical protein